jgi:hypothetical protein
LLIGETVTNRLSDEELEKCHDGLCGVTLKDGPCSCLVHWVQALQNEADQAKAVLHDLICVKKPTPEEMLAYYYSRAQKEKRNPFSVLITMNEQDFRMILAVLGKSHDEIMSMAECTSKKILRLEGADPEWVQISDKR